MLGCAFQQRYKFLSYFIADVIGAGANQNAIFWICEELTNALDNHFRFTSS